MQNRNFRSILYFITVVIFATLSIQFYWNYKNYKDGKQQLIREVQSSVDNAIDSYYIELADRNTIGISLKKDGSILENPQVNSLLRKIDRSGKGLDVLNSIDPNEISEMKVISGSALRNKDTVFGAVNSPGKHKDLHNFFNDTRPLDTTPNMNQLAKRIIISLNTDTLEIPVLNNHIDEQLAAKNIDIDYAYIFRKKEEVTQKFNTEIVDDEVLSTSSNSAYLPKNSSFNLYFTNVATIVLQRNILGIILSAVLIVAVVVCLFFLLKIISRQKQLAELKNDLISNITHEFKTPISTAKVALEGIQNFNKENDPAKTKNYLAVSNIQLDKLQLMVEKLLETATLDGNNLQLNREEVPLVPMLSELVEKHRNLTKNKILCFSAEQQKIHVPADPFHLENALNNILDNAVKYGGDKIEISILVESQMVKIRISDNGTNLTKAQAEHLFEKFYRVPKGNTHDVKGFGIGLYYTKNIIKKHGGSIDLHVNNQTDFTIILPRNG
ncbi:hypothetical protein GCM10007103_31870 [Salinimicrobium marinum]|uniref:histidine kinase n=1 Tax=Salinimicrobium marinum TaxID=680283 RepID=A0A918W1U7_9FLAO|nr:HAMP domain-containing sensor histidine kinase [Salinimicrobium marinum]GHA48575.1 hypothetical protein GCM10007103_31870 [Salinimicrobium marinum]